MPMPRPRARKTSPPLLMMLLAAVLLSACAMSDEKLAGMLVAPGKFELYTCPELAAKATEITKRQQELEGLMAKAGTDSTGRLVSTLAYRPDYLSGRGEMKDVREAQAAKNCDQADAGAAAAPAAGAAAQPGAGGQRSKATLPR